MATLKVNCSTKGATLYVDCSFESIFKRYTIPVNNYDDNVVDVVNFLKDFSSSLPTVSDMLTIETNYLMLVTKAANPDLGVKEILVEIKEKLGASKGHLQYVVVAEALRQETVGGFRGDYWFLSNFCEDYFVEIDGLLFKSREAAFQAMKCAILEGSRYILRGTGAEEFTALAPADAKHYGKTVRKSADWNQRRIFAMTHVISACLEQNPEFAQKLVHTGNVELVEHNTWGDTYWGVCDGFGDNNLGKILMLLRKNYRGKLQVKNNFHGA